MSSSCTVLRGAVDLHVEPGVEQVLVVDRGEAGATSSAYGPARAVDDGLGLHDPGELHLELDRPVQVEVPVVAVVVVQVRADRRDDQPALPPNLGVVFDEVPVLPEDREVLLVQADALLDDERFAEVVVRDDVEVLDHAKAVAAELERVDAATDAEVAEVEGALPEVRRVGVAVGHDHLRERRAVDDRPDGRRRSSHSIVCRTRPSRGVERPAEPPVLPADLVAVDGEARPVRLGDLDAGAGPSRIGAIDSAS